MIRLPIRWLTTAGAIFLYVAGVLAQTAEVRVFTGARIFDGTGDPVIARGVIVVRDGRIEQIGPADQVIIPQNASQIDLSGKFIVPGLINTHGHAGGTRGLNPDAFSEENLVRQLALYARYGITTVVSLGGDRQASADIRNRQNDPRLDHARLFIAGTVVAARNSAEAESVVQANVSLGVDVLKIRVDDNLGAAKKMDAGLYRSIIALAHRHGLPVAAHIYYLDDAKGVLMAGADFIAHSVRDMPVDHSLIRLLKERQAGYCPTLTREVSAFVYETTPAFFDDPFFVKDADPEAVRALENPQRQALIRADRAAQSYKTALDMAVKNLKTLVGADVLIAFGTDSGPPGRFQGYFEHLEMNLMVRAGMTPQQILLSATGHAARCFKLTGIGTLKGGHWADFVVLTGDPLEDIRNMRQIEAVYIAGNRVPGVQQRSGGNARE